MGEPGIIAGRPKALEVEAVGNVIVAHIPLRALREILNEEPAGWQYIAVLAEAHSAFFLGARDDLAIRDPTKRCIAVLLRLADRHSNSREKSLHADIDMSQQQIAMVASVVRATLNKVLRKLEEGGMIQRSYRRIRILAPDVLRTMLRD
jgi:CRP-like cAMP-binding protein